MSTAITRKQIIEDEALKWGEEYVRMLEPAVKKNKEFVDTILALSEANKILRASSNDKEYQLNLKKTNELGEKATTIWKEQIQLEDALISTKRKNLLATESTNRELIKERVLLAETNKQVKQQAREILGQVSSYEKLNRLRTEAQKTLANLLSAEKQNREEIVRAQIEFDRLDARVKAVDEAIKNYSKNIGNYQSAFEGLGGTLQDLVAAFGVVTGALTFSSILGDIISVIREFDSQLIAVGKTANINGEDLKNFGRAVVELGGQLNGVSIQGLLKSSEVAGTLGVQGTENILKFSRAIEELKLTSDIISDEQVGQFAKFIEVSADSFKNADRLASVITRLGNEFATTEAEVLSNATEIQKGVSVYNASAQSVLGLGAATASLGNEAEVSSSSISKAFGVIDNAVATGKNLDKILKLTNLSQKQLSEQFQKDASGTFVKFIEGLSKAKDEGQNLRVILQGLELDEVRTFKTIGSLASNYELLKNSLIAANEEYTVNTALSNEVVKASESIDSIISDITDKWQEYILKTSDANDGTERIASALKFLRDNLQSIISNVVKYGSVLLVFLGIQKAVNFAITAWTALKTAATAAQIRFALSTGIGTQSILAEAAALRAAAAAQGELNVAMVATPWGIILAAITAAVFAYKVFQDELSETEIRVNAVRAAQKRVADDEAYYSDVRDKNREKEFKAIEDEIALRKAKGENSKKLDDEEIARKKAVVEGQLKVFNDLEVLEQNRTKSQIDASNKRVAALQKEFDSQNKYALQNPFGESIKDKEVKLINAKAENDALKATLEKGASLAKAETDKLNAILTQLEKDKQLKIATIQAEADKKAIEAAKRKARQLYELAKKLADDEFKLSQFRLQVAIDLDNDIVQNEKDSFETRLNALLESQQLVEAKTTEAAEYELKKLGYYDEEKRRFIRELSDFQIQEILRTGATSKKLTDAQQLIYEKFENDKTKAAKKGLVDRQALIDGEFGVIEKRINQQLLAEDTKVQKLIQKENELYLQALKIAKDNYELTEQAKKEHENRLLKISQDAHKEQLKLYIQEAEAFLKTQDVKEGSDKISSEKRIAIENAVQKAKTELGQIGVEQFVLQNQQNLLNAEEYANRRLELEKEMSDRIKDVSQSLAYAVTDFTNALFERRIANIDAEQEHWTEYYDSQIEMAGNDARQKDLLEKEKARKLKEIDDKRKKEQYKQALINRAFALAEIAFNTTKAVMAVASTGGGTYYADFGVSAATLTALTIALGATQAAAVLATPLPKYKGGREKGPAEFAWVGDGYKSEVVTDPDGTNPRLTPAFPTLTYLKKDERVYSDVDDYKKHIGYSMKADQKKTLDEIYQYQINVNSSTTYDKELLNEMKLTRKAIEKNKGNIVLNNTIDFGHHAWSFKNINWRA